MKVGIRLDGQVICGEVPRRELDRRRKVGLRLHQGLLGQAVHEIEVDVVEVGAGDLDRAARLMVIVNATERLEMPRVEALYADRQAIDAQSPKRGELVRFEGAGIGFQA